MSIGVAPQDNLAGWRRGKAAAVERAEGSKPGDAKARTQASTGGGEPGRELQGELGNLGEPRVSWGEKAGRAGVPADQEPWRGPRASSGHRARQGTQTLGAAKVGGSERHAKRPKRGTRQS
jgi:hypothetical protein